MKSQLIAAVAAACLVACGQPDGQPSQDMTSMSAEEHARMQAGTGRGQQDSTGANVRNPVHLTAEQERSLGVTYTTVTRENLVRTIRTVGRVLAPEPNIVEVTPKIDGFVEQMFVDVTGQSVRRGEPLLTLYSPALVAAQEELLTARKLAQTVNPDSRESWTSAQDMLQAARRRLSYWDITPSQIDDLEQSGQVQKALALVSPISGIVLERAVLPGQRVMPGQRLYQIADLTAVWIEGDVFEQDLELARIGAEAHIEVAAYPGDHTMGVVSFVYPTLDQTTRTARIRVTVPNRDLRLKPGMFATLFFDVPLGDDALTIPEEALIATGERNLVFVRGADGMLQSRAVVVGHRASGRVVILSGLSEGQVIVASGNFLVDAESRLGGSSEMPGMQHGTVAPSMSDSAGSSHR